MLDVYYITFDNHGLYSSINFIIMFKLDIVSCVGFDRVLPD